MRHFGNPALGGAGRAVRHRRPHLKVGHDSHLRADNGRISLPNPDKQTISAGSVLLRWVI